MRLNTLINALRIIDLLGRKKLTVHQISEETGIRVRSVYRYIEAISLVLPIYEEKNKGRNEPKRFKLLDSIYQ